MEASPYDKLTRRQRDVLVFVTAYWRTHGRSPRLKEISAALGYGRDSSPARLIERLEKCGQIYRGFVPVSLIG